MATPTLQQKATSWMANIRTVVRVSVAGYVFIWAVWLIMRVASPTSADNASDKYWLKQLYDETAPFTFAWSVFVGAVSLAATGAYQKWLAATSLRESQKQRIRILNNFHPSSRMRELFDKRSIYDAIMGMLRRLQLEQEKSQGIKPAGKIHYNVCMLLCSPALDYWANEESRTAGAEIPQWGLEFRNIVEKLVANTNTEFHVCHLPVLPSSGVNALSNFLSALAAFTIQTENQFKPDNAGRSKVISALAAYIRDNNVVSEMENPGKSAPLVEEDAFRNVYGLLWHRSKMVANDFSQWSNDADKKDRIHLQTHTINIPFQVLLVDSEEFMEVVISFAGREVLERKQEREIKGFYSSDPYVVKTFREVFLTYIDSRGRFPYIPPHTSNISARHDEIGAHLIPSYYNNLVKNLYVLPQAFSPVVGNSTKFTVWLLDKLLTTGNPDGSLYWGHSVKKVLDVGSGTGVLALACSAILRDRCSNNNYSIMAIDSCPYAQQILKMNTAQDKTITIKPWALSFKEDDKAGIADPCFKDDAGRQVPISGEFAGFDLIIADLPFVHAQARTNSDLRFLDYNHDLHQALFRMLKPKDSRLLSQKGLLVTAFSSLGGGDDIAEFKRYVHENDLQITQRVDFYESGYAWMVYVLMRNEGYKLFEDKLWWKALGADNFKPWTPPPNVPIIENNR